jgi:LmbE family N-acetylglucosaminyl deacetylase
MAHMKADVLVMMPHPDDSEFGCAGTVARWAKEGRAIVYVIFTNGDKGSSDRSLTPAKLAKIRQGEQREAARVLGVREVVFLGYSDQELEDTPDLRKALVRQIRLYQPRTVVTVDPYRRYIWHRDHRMAGQVVLDAVLPYARDFLAYPDLLAEGLEPHKVTELLFTAADDVNHIIDITDTFDLKIEALACHRSQVGDRLPEIAAWLKQRAMDAAKGTACEMVETFHYVDVDMVGPYRKKEGN